MALQTPVSRYWHSVGYWHRGFCALYSDSIRLHDAKKIEQISFTVHIVDIESVVMFALGGRGELRTTSQYIPYVALVAVSQSYSGHIYYCTALQYEN